MEGKLRMLLPKMALAPLPHLGLVWHKPRPAHGKQNRFLDGGGFSYRATLEMLPKAILREAKPPPLTVLFPQGQGFIRASEEPLGRAGELHCCSGFVWPQPCWRCYQSPQGSLWGGCKATLIALKQVLCLCLAQGDSQVARDKKNY